MPSRPAETAVLAGLGLDGASCHRQTHSSCPEAPTRLIEPERRGCTVDYEVVPGIGTAGPSTRQCVTIGRLATASAIQKVRRRVESDRRTAVRSSGAGQHRSSYLVDPASSHMLVPAQWASHSEQGTAHLLTKLIPHRGPLARDGTSGQGFAATGLAAASHGQVAISMAEAKARRRRPAPSETEVARVHRQSQRAGPVQRCLRAGKRMAATS